VFEARDLPSRQTRDRPSSTKPRISSELARFGGRLLEGMGTKGNGSRVVSLFCWAEVGNDWSCLVISQKIVSDWSVASRDATMSRQKRQKCDKSDKIGDWSGTQVGGRPDFFTSSFIETTADMQGHEAGGSGADERGHRERVVPFSSVLKLAVIGHD
jgi:hypothetical protein